MKIAVIASNSFSGSNLIDLLLENKENEIIGISRSEEYNETFLPYKRHKKANFKFYKLNINDNILEIFNVLDKFQPEYIVNFAAQGEVGTSWKYPHHWFQTNAVGIVQFTNELKEKKYLKKYIHISTPEVYGSCNGQNEKEALFNPSTPYAASKASGDLFLTTLFKQYKFPVIFIRSTNVYGVGQQLYRIIPRTVIFLKNKKKIELHGGGKAIKSYIHIKDVCRGIIKAMALGEIGEIYHFSPEEEISIRDLVKKISFLMGKDFEKSTKDVSERLGQDSRYFLDSSKAKKTLNWKCEENLEEGLLEMIEWIDKNFNEINNMTTDYVHKI